MGKRKSRQPSALPKRKLPKLETFCCPFCNHPDSVECVIDLKHRIAEASCSVCHESYCTICHAFTKPVDVYSDWIDECEEANDGVVRGAAAAAEYDD